MNNVQQVCHFNLTVIFQTFLLHWVSVWWSLVTYLHNVDHLTSFSGGTYCQLKQLTIIRFGFQHFKRGRRLLLSLVLLVPLLMMEVILQISLSHHLQRDRRGKVYVIPNRYWRRSLFLKLWSMNHLRSVVLFQVVSEGKVSGTEQMKNTPIHICAKTAFVNLSPSIQWRYSPNRALTSSTEVP
jgi:hypothetical protein